MPNLIQKTRNLLANRREVNMMYVWASDQLNNLARTNIQWYRQTIIKLLANYRREKRDLVALWASKHIYTIYDDGRVWARAFLSASTRNLIVKWKAVYMRMRSTQTVWTDISSKWATRTDRSWDNNIISTALTLTPYRIFVFYLHGSCLL